MHDATQDEEDRTRGFVPPEPRGLGMRSIALAVVIALGVVFVLAKVLPARDAAPAPAVPAAQPVAK